MYDINDPTQELSVAQRGDNPEHDDGCPVCGGPIRAIERRGPSEVSVSPCGHDITNVQAFALAAPERSAAGDREYATDGGERKCEVPHVDEHCGSVWIVVDEEGDVVAMCWECRRKFPYQRVVDKDPDPAMADGGYSVEVTADDGSVPLDTEADLYAYVQDGPTVVVWTFNTTVAGEVQVGEFHVHQGTDRTHGVTYEDIEKGTSLTDFARRFAREHADGGLENARESFGLSTDADRETEVSA